MGDHRRKADGNASSARSASGQRFYNRKRIRVMQFHGPMQAPRIPPPSRPAAPRPDPAAGVEPTLLLGRVPGSVLGAAKSSLSRSPSARFGEATLKAPHAVQWLSDNALNTRRRRTQRPGRGLRGDLQARLCERRRPAGYRDGPGPALGGWFDDDNLRRCTRRSGCGARPTTGRALL
jgi:hypothetical protein